MSLPSLPSSVDILIVGAGPVGIACAIALTLAGQNFVIAEERTENYRANSRALAVHARTLELLETIGVADRMVSQGSPRQELTVLTYTGTPVFAVDFRALPTKYPFLLAIPQSETENILYERLKELGRDVLFGKKAIALSEDGPLKVVTFESGEHVRAKYVIGADGGHSAIRNAANIAYKDAEVKKAPPSRFIVADLKVKDLSSNLPTDNVGLQLAPEGATLWFAMKGGIYRLAAQATADGPAPELTQDLLQDMLEERLPGGNTKITEVVWTSSFMVRYRLAETFYKPSIDPKSKDDVAGGIAVIGDAGHTHPPVAGQGMNLGIRDAITLAKAITKDLKAQDKSHAAMREWGVERRKMGQGVIALTSLITAWITLPPGFYSFFRDYMLWGAGSFPWFRQRAGYEVSGLKDRYVPS